MASPRPADESYHNGRFSGPVAIGQHTRLVLRADGAATFDLPPRARPGDGAFAGHVTLRTGRAGLYRVSASQRVWIDLVADGVPALAVGSDKRLRCAGIAKNLSFELTEDTRYSVQVSGGIEAAIDILITPPE